MLHFHTLAAYIDPGTGAIALQVLMALVLGAGIFLRRILSAPLALFRRKKVETPVQTQNDDLREAA